MSPESRNERLNKTGPTTATATRLLYDGDALVAEYDSSGNLLRRYVHGPGVDEPLVWYEGSTVGSSNRRFLHADHEGSIVAVSDASGNLLRANTYDEYGIPGAANSNLANQRFAYTGQILIPELGLYHYKARAYSPVLGRFMQVDPVGYKDQVNLYAYVGNDPIDGRDPSGLTCTKVESNRDPYICKVDDTSAFERTRTGELTKASQQLLTKIEKAYTAAVNKLLRDPGKPKQIGGSQDSVRVLVNVSQGSIAQSLISANVKYGGVAPPEFRALTSGTIGQPGGVNITMYDRAVDARRTGMQISQTFVHEGAHGTTEEVVARNLWNAQPDAGVNWNDAHQDQFKRMAREVMTDEE